MTDLDLNKPGVENQNIPDNDCDGDSLPECLILSEPLPDPYDSDILENRKEETKEKTLWLTSSPKEFCDVNNTRSRSRHKSLFVDGAGDLFSTRSKNCDINEYQDSRPKIKYNAADLNQQFFEEHFDALYSYVGPQQKLFNSDSRTLIEVLDDMFFFALQNNKHRMQIDMNGIRKYDGMTIEEIISLWGNGPGNVAWLMKNFNVDVNFDNLDAIYQCEKLVELSSRPPMTSEEMVAFTCFQVRKQFMNTIQNILLDKGRDYRPGTSKDELLDNYTPLLPQLASVTGITHKLKGSCKFRTVLTDVKKVKNMEVTTKPDFIFQTEYDNTNALNIPVEVYSPNTSGNYGTSSSTESTLNSSQMYRQNEKLTGHHVMQHVAVLVDQYSMPVKKQVDEKSEISQIGLFMTKEKIRFTKVKTNLKHLSSVVEVLLQGEHIVNPVTKIPRMKMLREEKGLKIEFSNWCVDLTKAIHRNALMIFLGQYIHWNLKSK